MTRPSTIRGAALAVGALLVVAGAAFAMPGPDRTDAEDHGDRASASPVATFGAELDPSASAEASAPESPDASPEESPEASAPASLDDDDGEPSDLSSDDLEELFGPASQSPEASFDDADDADDADEAEDVDDADDADEAEDVDDADDADDDADEADDDHDDDSDHGSDDSGHDD